jgi:Zn-finger protein
MQKIKHSGKQVQCKYYPCHIDLEDCTFCYCPYYPCEDETLGDWLESLNDKIWDCSYCTWIHQVETVSQIYDLIDGD